uniref:GDP-Man:Man(3)GlcNAc(2)-PP-Dol alpha-1,2-mannosyltransferase n=1 Tax=Meloidogyne incognita TaxID=6306 RepID=A0A914MF53_MELIC
MPFSILIPFIILLIFIYFLFLYIRRKRISDTFAFFHPYCDACGGGERVLWLALNAMHQSFPDLNFIVYTGDIDRTPQEILTKVNSRFGISVPTNRLQFIFLRSRWLLEAKNYPRFTLIAQLFAGLIVGFEALWRFCPEWFMDTTGCPLTLPLFYWLGGAKTLCYVHYPTITTEMIQLVDSRTPTYNNSSTISSSFFLTKLKLIYYRIVALLYKSCGGCSQLTMANGSWTSSHIEQLWSIKPKIVFPPCNVERLLELENNSEYKLENNGENNEEKKLEVSIISVGQIRPEKNHLEQLRIFADVRRLLLEQKININVKLIIAGGCRNEEDTKRVEFLQNYAKKHLGMKVGDEIDWELNIDFERLLELMKNSLIGLHTMWNEHFGISVVEGMAAGVIMVAHNSGGPALDIIGNENLNKVDEEYFEKCGFLASTREEYVNIILKIITKMNVQDRKDIREAARRKALIFSDKFFEIKFCNLIGAFLTETKET